MRLNSHSNRIKSVSRLLNELKLEFEDLLLLNGLRKLLEEQEIEFPSLLYFVPEMVIKGLIFEFCSSVEDYESYDFTSKRSLN